MLTKDGKCEGNFNKIYGYFNPLLSNLEFVMI